MRIIKTLGRRGRGDFWTVNGVASCLTPDEAFALLTGEFVAVLEAMPVAERCIAPRITSARAGELGAEYDVRAAS